MARSKPTGPMTVQPTDHGSILPMLPMMPTVGNKTKIPRPFVSAFLGRDGTLEQTNDLGDRPSSFLTRCYVVTCYNLPFTGVVLKEGKIRW
jgi:hypothetical protein